MQSTTGDLDVREKGDESRFRVARQGVSRRQFLWSLVAAAAPVAVLSACGGSGTASAVTSTASASSPATATSAAVVSTSSATATAATSSAGTTASSAASPSVATTAAVQPAGNVSSAPATVVWMTRTDVHENKWEKTIAIPDFEKANPTIKINWINTPWAQYFPKQMTMNAAGTPPDLWVPYGSTGARGYEAVSMVHDLTSFVQRDKIDMSGFPKPVLDFFTIDGHLVAYPYMTCGSFIFYNKDLFQKAGIAFPTTSWDDKSWTIDSVRTLAGKLTKNYGKPDAQYGVSGHMGMGTDSWLWDADPWSADGYTTGYPSKADFTAAPVQAAYTYLTDLIFKDKVAPSPDDMQAISSTTNPFVSQRIAMSWTGGWGLWSYKDVTFKLGVAPLPWHKANTAPIWPDAYLMAAKTKSPEQAWSLMKYLGGPVGVKGYMEATGAPPANQQYLDQYYQIYKPVPMQELKPVAEGSMKYGKIPPPHAFVDTNQIESAMSNTNGAMWHGKTPVAQALPAVQAAVTKIIAPNVGKKISFTGGTTVVS